MAQTNHQCTSPEIIVLLHMTFWNFFSSLAYYLRMRINRNFNRTSMFISFIQISKCHWSNVRLFGNCAFYLFRLICIDDRFVKTNKVHRKELATETSHQKKLAYKKGHCNVSQLFVSTIYMAHFLIGLFILA